MSFGSVQEMFSTFVEDHLASVVIAVLVFVVGLVVLFLAISLLKNLVLRPLGVNRYFAKLTGRSSAPFDLEKAIARLVLISGLLWIFSSVAQISGSDYFVELFDAVFIWLGSVLGMALKALFPIVLALVFSYLAKTGALWTGEKFKLDERLGQKLDVGEPVSFSITKSVSEIIYGIVFLYFVPQIFVGLGLEKLSEPLTNMFAEFFAFLPRLVTAVVIICIFWFVAKILRQILEGVLNSFGVDAFISKILGENFLGSLKLSKLLPAFVYALLIGVGFVEALRRLQFDTITAPLEKLIENAVAGLPNLLGAIILISGAVFLGRLIAAFVSNLLKDVGFDGVYSKIGLADIKTGGQTPSAIVGALINYGLIFLASLQALGILGLTNLSSILETLMFRMFDVVVGVLVFGVGLFIAKNLASWVEQATHASYSKLLALIVKTVVIVIATAMALQQVGIADEIVKIAFTLAMGSVALGVAIAIGLGGKDTAGEIVKKFISKFNG